MTPQILLLVSAQAAAAPQDGFRQLNFDTPCDSVAGFELVETTDHQSPLTIYRQPADSLNIGTVTLRSIRYTCAMGKLMAVDIAAPAVHGPQLLATLTKAWGKPDISDSSNGMHMWTGEIPASLSFNSRGPAALELHWKDDSLYQQWWSLTRKLADEEQQNRAEAAQDDL